MSERDAKFLELEREVNRRGGDGEAVVEAYRELYDFHDIRMCEWLARLFNPDIGGFYFSNSARDTEYVEYNGKPCKTGPDIESTHQAVRVLTSTGMISKPLDLPAWMVEKIKDFTCSLQDPDDGYIYHPQWQKRIGPSRRGRDLMWANDLASKFGFKMPYPTATERLRAAAANPDKREEMLSNAPEHLRSEAAFKKYLESLDWDDETGWGAYAAGNNLAAQADMIVAAGLREVGCQFLDSIQNKETGLWGKGTSLYMAVNAILKITAFYGRRPIPNAEKVAMASMDAITTTEVNDTVCYQYNTWFSVCNIRGNLKRAGGEENEAVLRRIDAEMLRRAPECIRATTRKAAPFKCEDGSYDYSLVPPASSCHTSQGAPVSLSIREGNINATLINGPETLGFSLGAMELRPFAPVLFGKEGYDRFLAALPKPTK